MNPLLITISFIILLSSTTASQLISFKSTFFEKVLYDKAKSAKETTYLALTKARFDDFKEEHQSPESPSTKKDKITNDQQQETSAHEKPNPISDKPTDQTPKSLNFNLMRPPNNARLNFYTLLHDSHCKSYPAEFSIYETAAQLLRSLYRDQPFFHEIPGAEYKILDALAAKKDESKNFIFPDQLAGIFLGDEKLQLIFVQMLKGASPKYPSLLHHITFDKEGTIYDKRINFMFASPELIKVLLGSVEAATQILTIREEYWKLIQFQESNRSHISKEDWLGRKKIKDRLSKDLTTLLHSYNCSTDYFEKVFDFSLGKKGNIVFLQDSSGILVREKHSSKSPKPSPKSHS